MSLHIAETLCFASAISLFSYRMKWLTGRGALAQFLLGALLFGFGGWQWTLPVLLFFLTSSALTRLGRDRKSDASRAFSKAGTRDAAQVAANGGIGGALVVAWALTGGDLWYRAYMSAVAAAAADTWATEIGLLSGGAPLLITTFRRVRAGTSGGISLWGTCAGIAGSAFIAGSGLPWMRGDYRMAILVTLSGVAGLIADSLLGATLQREFLCGGCGEVTENEAHCVGFRGVHARGIRWLTNDMVNLAATLTAALAGGILPWIL